MLAPTAGNVSLRTVSSSRPQLLRTESQQSIAASDDYYSFSSRTSTTTRSASNGSRATVVRYATPSSHPVSRTSSPEVSRTRLAPVGPVPRIEALESAPAMNGADEMDSRSQPPQKRTVQMSAMSDALSRQTVGDSYAGPAPTPGLDDSPYIRFAINQLTRDGDNGSTHSRRVSEAASQMTPTGRLVWDDSLGYFVRGSSGTPPVQQPLLPPEERRNSQGPIDPEAFIPIDPPEGSLLYPPLNFVPLVLRPWALAIAIVCVLLMIAGIVFSNVWSRDNQGIWHYQGRGSSRYFVVQFLPQILGVIVSIWTFTIQAAVYRVMPFTIMATERPFRNVLRKLPILPRNFLLPDLSHILYGEALVGFSLFTIWLSNFITLPLLSCLFQAKWYVIDSQGQWRWTTVWAVGWTLVGVYGLLAIGLILLMIRFFHTWSGLMWDPVSLADLISIVQRTNILHDFEFSETAPDVSESIDPRVLRLGYWQLSRSASQMGIFYGIGESNAPIGITSMHGIMRNPQDQSNGLSKDSVDVEQQEGAEKDNFDNTFFSPSIRYRWTPWFLRRVFVIIWIVVLSGLFIAFVVVSFVHNAIADGFPPRLPTLPSTGAFSSSNFLFGFIPALAGNLLFLAWQHIDFYFRALQPFAMLASPDGVPAEQSLLLAYPSFLPIQVTLQAVINKHYKVAWISLMSLISGALPILAGGVFIALYYPAEDQVRISAEMPAFYATIVFCALYMLSFLLIWPSRRRCLPHDISTLADLISFLYQSPLLSDKLLREPRSKTDLVTRLVIAPPGEQELPRFGFGVYVGRDGKEHLGIDRFRRPGRADMLIRTTPMT